MQAETVDRKCACEENSGIDISEDTLDCRGIGGMKWNSVGSI